MRGLRPAVFDCATGFLGKVSTLSKEGKEKKFHDTDDNRDYTTSELDEMTQYKRQLELWGDFVFPFWENNAVKTGIPDAVVFCRQALYNPTVDEYNLKHYGHAVRNGQKTNNAIRPELEKHAKKCYETWKHIDLNDGKLPKDDLKTFDDWEQSSGCISTSVGSYPRMTYPSPTFHTTVFALSGVVI